MAELPKIQFSSTGVLVSSKVNTANGRKQYIAVVTPVNGETVTVNHGANSDFTRRTVCLTESTKAPYAATTSIVNESSTTFTFPAAGTYRIIVEY